MKRYPEASILSPVRGMTTQRLSLSLILLLTLAPATSQQQSEITVQPEIVYSGQDFPVAITFSPDGRLFYNEKDTGNIRIIKGGRLLATPFARLDVVAGGERGLLGLELDPNFASNGFVYVYYTYRNESSVHVRITRFRAEGDVGVAPVHMFDLEDPSPGSANHNGGYIKFGPDGKLFVQIGEFGNAELAESIRSYAGKILRMNPNGSIPSDNPRPDSLVYALGIRNGFGMDFEPGTGVLLATEAGPERNDEINLIESMKNYGWPRLTGIVSASEDRLPVRNYRNPILVISQPTTPTGIAFTKVKGAVVFGEFNTGNLNVMTLDNAWQVTSLHRLVTVGSSYNGILAVEMSPDGSIYFTTSNSTFRIQYPPVTVPKETSPEPTPTISPAVAAAAAVLIAGVGLGLFYLHRKPGHSATPPS